MKYVIVIEETSKGYSAYSPALWNVFVERVKEIEKVFIKKYI